MVSVLYMRLSRLIIVIRFDYDDDRETHCTISLPAWRSLLKQSGFQCLTFSASPLEEDHSLVFLAQKADVTASLLASEETYDRSQLASALSGSDRSHFVFQYTCGEEMALRDALVSFDPTETLSVWICAADNSNGSAARGLVRTLTKEFPVWELHLVIFHSDLSEAQRAIVISQLQQRPSCETEISVNESGDVHIPRVVPLSSPVLEVPFDNEGHWSTINGQIAHVSLPPLGQYDIVVEVSYWSSLASDVPRAFIGTVSHSNYMDFVPGDCVMGLTNGSLSNRLTVHAGSVVKCEPSKAGVLSSLPGLVSAILLLGPATLKRPGRLAAIKRVLVTDIHTAIGQAATLLLRHIGLDVFVVGQGDSDALAEKLKMPASRVFTTEDSFWIARERGKYDIILSGAKEKPVIQTVSAMLSPQGAIYYWNDETYGLSSSLKRDPWLVSLAIETVLQITPDNLSPLPAPIAIQDSVSIPSGSPVIDQTLVFDPRKTYLLVGGIGGMGVQMALWMYEVSPNPSLR